jgi:hypothetical protein
MLLPSCASADLVISSGATSQVQCTNGKCTPTAADAVLNYKDLRTLLSQGDLQIVAHVNTPNIRIEKSFAWANTHQLVLDASGILEFDRTVVAQGTKSGVTLRYLTLIFGTNAALQFADTASTLNVNGTSFTLVASIADLAGAIGTNSKGHYALAHDYDAKADGIYTASPIVTLFEGTFEGLGNQISHLTINAPGSDVQTGLFSRATGLLSDVGLTKVNIKVGDGFSQEVGALAGRGLSITNAWGTGRISVGISGIAGGLVGSGGVITNSHFTGTVSAGKTSIVGGLAGMGAATNCWASGSVSGGDDSFAGGLIGQLDGDVSLSQSSATVIVGNSVAGAVVSGGLVGEGIAWNISQSFASGRVSAGTNNDDVVYVGGLLGEGRGTITDSFATGAVSGGDGSVVGGLLGEHSMDVLSSYSTSHVQAGAKSTTGGLIGSGSGKVQSAYWNTDTSGQTQGKGSGHFNGNIVGLTTSEFTAGLPVGFDPATWAEKSQINDGYPYLVANPPQ